jgi:hypothetical protein
MSHPDDTLAALIGALRDAESGDTAPAHVEAALMQAWDASHAAPAARKRFTAAAPFAALAAGAVLTAGLSQLGGHLRSATVARTSVAADMTPTVILVGEPILDGEQVRLVRVRLPASALHALGVRSTAASPADIDVDIVVGEDGVARALSFNR